MGHSWGFEPREGVLWVEELEQDARPRVRMVSCAQSLDRLLKT